MFNIFLYIFLAPIDEPIRSTFLRPPNIELTRAQSAIGQHSKSARRRQLHTKLRRRVQRLVMSTLASNALFQLPVFWLYQVWNSDFVDVSQYQWQLRAAEDYTLDSIPFFHLGGNFC